jgi:hypothetical protein
MNDREVDQLSILTEQLFRYAKNRNPNHKYERMQAINTLRKLNEDPYIFSESENGNDHPESPSNFASKQIAFLQKKVCYLAIRTLPQLNTGIPLPTRRRSH